jgi:hypothetical protein
MDIALKILIYIIVLLAEIALCMLALKLRVWGKQPFVSGAVALLAMLAFFFTVAILATPECSWSFSAIVCSRP